MFKTDTLENQEVLAISSTCITEGRDFAIFRERSFNRNFYIIKEGIEEATTKLLLENRVETLKSLLRSLDFSLKIGYIKSQVSEFTEEAESFLIKDKLLIDVVIEVIEKIKDIINRIYLSNKIKIYSSKDMEVPRWEELVISVRIEEENFDRIIEIWDEIEKRTEEIIDRTKQEKNKEISHLEGIDNKLAIEVESLENV